MTLFGEPAVPSAPQERWPLSGTLALFAAGWLVLSWPWLSGAVTIPWDAKAHFYPQLQFLAQSLHRGELPFWTPYVFSGAPQVADPQSLIFSPPFLALALLDANPSFRAADAAVLGMLALGGVAIVALFRDRGWHAAGALVAAFAFAFGGAAAWRIQHIGQILSLAWLPIAFWLLTRALERHSPAYGLASGVAAGLMVLGRDQVAYLGVWVLSGAVLAHWLDWGGGWRAIRADLVPLACGAIGGALVVTVPVLMTLLLAEGSNRPAIDHLGAGQGSLHPALLLTAVAANLFGADGPLQNHWGPPSPLWGSVDLFLARNMGQLYIGALPIALIMTAALRPAALWSREIRFFTVLAALVLLYALGRYTPFFRAAFAIVPGVDLFRRPADAVFLVGFAAGILSGYVTHCWCQGSAGPVGRLRRTFAGVLVVVPVALCVAVPIAKDTFHLAHIPITVAALCLAAALVVIAFLPLLAARSTAATLVLVTLVMTADLRVNNGPNESTALPTETYDVLRPGSGNPIVATLKARTAETASDTRMDRVELTGLGFHWPNASLVHRLHNVLGYNPLRLGAYTSATGAGDHVALPEQRTFAPLFPSYRSVLADLLGLRFIVTGVPVEQIDPKLRPGDLKLLAETGDGFVYENPRAAPRAAFATVARVADFAALLRDGNWPDVDFSRTVLVEAGAPQPETANRAAPAAGRVRIVTYRNTEVVIDVEAAADGYVVLSDPWHPWWQASVDGQHVPMLRANVLFRAVWVPTGSHTVRFEFRPLAGLWRQVKALTGF
jgi:hypothetical protein